MSEVFASLRFPSISERTWFILLAYFAAAEKESSKTPPIFHGVAGHYTLSLDYFESLDVSSAAFVFGEIPRVEERRLSGAVIACDCCLGCCCILAMVFQGHILAFAHAIFHVSGSL